MENEIEKQERFIAVPNQVSAMEELSTIDLLVYAGLKSFDGKDGCYPSLKTLSERINVPQRTIKRSIQNLKDYKVIQTKVVKGSSTHYIFLINLLQGFEPFSYEFLEDKTLSPNVKGFLIMLQQYMYKNSETEGAISATTYKLSQLLNIDYRTIQKYEKELKNHNILTVVESDALCEDSGYTKKQIRYYNFTNFCQIIAYTLRHVKELNDRVGNVENEINTLREEHRELQREIKERDKTIELLQRELRRRDQEDEKSKIITL